MLHQSRKKVSAEAVTEMICHERDGALDDDDGAVGVSSPLDDGAAVFCVEGTPSSKVMVGPARNPFSQEGYTMSVVGMGGSPNCGSILVP